MNDPASLYIHVPFCLKKCDYCDFYSITDYSFEERFVDAAIKELDYYSKTVQSTSLKSIFFGGGTLPSSMNIDLFRKLFNAIQSRFNILEDAEITIESNPASADLQKILAFRMMGVNRISIGVQSFIDEELKMLGRLHNSKTATAFVKAAEMSGFDDISLDLIIALPNQNIEKLEYSLNQALDLPINHISAYTLILEPGTPLFDSVKKQEITLLDEEEEADLHSYAVEYLSSKGFEQYEISNFAKDGKYSQHNLNYWECGEYIGIGPSAHGFINGIRYSNANSIHEYFHLLNKGENSKIEENALNEWDKISEKFFLGLRARGVDYHDFYQMFGINLKIHLDEELKEWSELGLIKPNNDKLELSLKGRAICDELSAKSLKKIEKAFKDL